MMDTEHGGISSEQLTLPPVRQARSGVGPLRPAKTKATPSLPQSDSNFQLPQMMAERKAELISPSSALLKGFVMVWEKQSQKIRLPLSSESAGEAGGWAFGSCHCARPLHPPTPMNSPHTGWRACGRSSREYRRKHKVPQNTPHCFEIYTDSRDEANQVTGSCETVCSGIFYKLYFTEKVYMKCLTSGKSGQLFDLSMCLCVKKKALYIWSQSRFDSSRLGPCTLYLLKIATNSLTTLRQVCDQQAENSTFPLFLWRK